MGLTQTVAVVAEETPSWLEQTPGLQKAPLLMGSTRRTFQALWSPERLLLFLLLFLNLGFDSSYHLINISVNSVDNWPVLSSRTIHTL